MLSSQTKDKATDVAVDKAATSLGGTVSLKALLAAGEHDRVIVEVGLN
jgi:hypothetical protein